MRRKIPSTQALACFEAAARHESYTRAAQELSLTQSAVSRQITALEDFLGVPLFRRTRHGVALTPGGLGYWRQVSRRLQGLERDTLDVMAQGGQGGSLALAAVPTFATRWLIPRLPLLAAQHPDIVVHIETRTRPFLFGDTAFDAATGSRRWFYSSDMPALTVRGTAGVTPGPGLVFVGNDGVHGAEPWRTDGTTAGTQMIKDVNPGAPDGSISWGDMASTFFTAVFFATDGIHGAEPWVTDGWDTGTAMLQDVCPGAAGSDPVGARFAHHRVWFRANDGVHGAEPWWTDGIVSFLTSGGGGCDGTGGSFAWLSIFPLLFVFLRRR